jgi:hypothetical protein
MTQLRLFDSYAPENTEYDIWENSLTAQFGSSLGRFLRQRNWPDLRATPDTTTDIIQNAERHADKPLDRSFLKLATQALAGQFVRTTIQGIVAECSAMCESPIELAMCFALGLAGCDKTHGVQFSCHGQVFGDSDRELSLTIEPQCNLVSIGRTSCLPCNWSKQLLKSLFTASNWFWSAMAGTSTRGRLHRRSETGKWTGIYRCRA